MERSDYVTADTYFQREIDVLKELDHPNVVKLAQTFPWPDHDVWPKPTFRSVALALAFGPTVQNLVEHRGCLGLPLAKMIARQLISAVAYLHGRAVVHRDIKPNNMIIAGASLLDNACWDDGRLGDNAILQEKWNLVLVDFGSCCAIGPHQISNLHKIVNPFSGFGGDISEYKHADHFSLNSAVDDKLSKSITAGQFLNVSMVGNRHFAAPEMMRGFINYSKALSQSIRSVRKKVKKEEPAEVEVLSGSTHGTRGEIDVPEVEKTNFVKRKPVTHDSSREKNESNVAPVTSQSDNGPDSLGVVFAGQE
eukprot:CAMPEP_0194448796 /NCGR_PEP_ID=MMETSP0176-20130528/129774_1 /TAXON_ID=216777 /ORGANISM="Proboscia alata, Strain PI-D3" /LENGTH=307 /DNA_ID=CAMNT_0039275829 /DNA_START=48 /DNA_END=972 /DNA_ORIENTATION=+